MVSLDEIRNSSGRQYPRHLFSGQHLRSVMNDVLQKVTNEISRYSLEQIGPLSDDSLIQRLYEENRLNVPNLIRDQAVQDQFQYYLSPYENPYLTKHQDTTHGTIVVVEVPFTGDKTFFSLRPANQTLSPPIGHVDESKLTFYVAARNLSPKQIESQFEATLDLVEQLLNAQSDTLRDFPMQFKQSAERAIAARVTKLNNDIKISRTLKYALKPRPEPVSIALPLVQKVIKPARTLPPSAAPEEHAALEEEHYQAILAVLDNMGRSMERSPVAIKDMGEESLRFLLLFQLNGHYEGTATGETFNHAGKTDILIRQNNANVFVAECKIWTGAAALTQAVDQLQKYVTWRDTKTALILFNRNKGFTHVIEDAIQTLVAHPNYKSGPVKKSDAQFRFVFSAQDDSRQQYSLTLMLFNVRRPD